MNLNGVLPCAIMNISVYTRMANQPRSLGKSENIITLEKVEFWLRHGNFNFEIDCFYGEKKSHLLQNL